MQAREHVRQKVVWGWGGVALILALALASGPACGPLQEAGRSGSYLMIDNLRGAPGVSPSEMSNALASDVLTVVTVGTNSAPTVFEDPGEVVFRLGLKDPGSPSAPNTPTLTNYITVTHYKIVYTRTDGRNTPGVDVPYPIEGGMTLTAVGGTTTGSFILVRAQAKREAPLQALIGSGGAVHISTTAEVTFYGHDQAGNNVSVVGYITVNFADWGDPQ
jgi:hypothetical protein